MSVPAAALGRQTRRLEQPHRVGLLLVCPCLGGRSLRQLIGVARFERKLAYCDPCTCIRVQPGQALPLAKWMCICTSPLRFHLTPPPTGSPSR